MPTYLTRAAAVVLAAGMTCVLGGANAAGQQATFRADVNYVEVDAIVTDAAGAFVHGLTAADFELFEDGQAMTIETFHEIDVPVERADRTLYSNAIVAADVASNDRTAEGRVYLLVLDDLHIRPTATLAVTRRAREFVERYVGSNDLVAVIHTSGRANVSQDFTSNRARVLQAIDGFMGRGLNSAVMNRMEEFNRRVQDGREIDARSVRDADSRERLGNARATFETVRNLATYLASLSGRRKAMLLFSEGMDFESVEGDALSGALSEMQDARRSMLEAIGAATRANVHVYTIDPAGLSSAGVGAETAFVPSDAAASSLGVTTQALAAERRNMRGALRTLAEQTGGVALVDTNNFSDGFSRIVRENSTYYLLGYYPSSKPDGKFHDLAVRVKRDGLTVRARAGYHAPKAGAPVSKRSDDPLHALISTAVPAPGLPMRLAVPAFKHTKARARVWMALDVPSGVFRFDEKDGVAAEELLLAYQVLEPGGKVAASSREDVQMRLQPGTRAAVERSGFRVILPVEVKPGRYQVRVAARTVNGARQGSVFADLVVPDFFTGPLAWSGVALTSASQVRVPTRPGDPDLAKAFPLMPSAARAFAPGDRLAVYAEAYDDGAGARRTVDLGAVIRDDTGRAVFSTAEERSSAELGGGRGGYGFRVEIPLAGIPPGSYVLTLTATSRGSRDAPATRDIPFTIGIS
ncbi:MAG: VWA domain-containing protein [Acidobacteria bacterium]|nr:VWA domain-containing protein [Acidobacteriota bacterium]